MAIRLIPGRRPALLLTLLTLTPLGCGLNEYESRMTALQRRVQRMDEENKLLGAPLDAPLRKQGDKSVEVASFYFRPPLGIPSKCAAEPRGGLLYDYTSTDAPPAAGTDKPSAIVRVELAFAPSKNKLSEELLRIFGKEESKTEWQTHQVEGDAGPLTFASTEASDDQYFYSINLYTDGASQAAIVYWIVKGSERGVGKIVDLSLSTLALDVDAVARRLTDQKPPWKLHEDPR